ncbi:MAG: hypothetical protein AC479_06345 [miscellaneous Crenarchaeota group-6 archaeon AD8-1]|nr:MAG: hypothetical protein AC479_06345 [miscellaneous Crenarchaeota group-6 archaeon AD8-1]
MFLIANSLTMELNPVVFLMFSKLFSGLSPPKVMKKAAFFVRDHFGIRRFGLQVLFSLPI